MAREKRWGVVSTTLTAQGTFNGVATVTSTLGLHTKAQVVLSQGASVQTYEVKKVTSLTTVELGPQGGGIDDRIDLTAFTAGATLAQKEQPRNSIPDKDIDRATYEEEPAVARRVLAVDPMGVPYSPSNPMPINGTVQAGSLGVEVQMSSKDDTPNPGDLHDSIRIGDQNHEAGVTALGELQAARAPAALQVDDFTTANVTYVGAAPVGSATSAAAWQIKKIDQTTGVVVTWAGSAAYNQVWDNRASLTYA
jgi:hypothetical protein